MGKRSAILGGTIATVLLALALMWGVAVAQSGPFPSSPLPQEGVGAPWHPQADGHPGSRLTTERVGDRLQRFRQPQGAPRVGKHDAGEPLGEDDARAIGPITEEATGMEVKANWKAATRQIGQGTVVATVSARGREATEGAGGCG
jgi:hypothetical protein